MPLSYLPTNEISTTIDAGILCVTIQRPERRNALSLGALAQLREIFTSHAGDTTIRYAVLRGAGDKAFASGGDVIEFKAIRTEDEARAMSEHGKRALAAVREFPTPVVAAINGLALGGGAELALACDLRFATPSARIGLIHARLNIAPSWGGGIDLMQLVGPARGLRLLATGEQLTAEGCLAIGLVDGIAPSDEGFDPALQQFLDSTLAAPPQVMRAIKSLALGQKLQGRQALEQAETEHFAKVWTHPDHWAAVAARTKVPPQT